MLCTQRDYFVGSTLILKPGRTLWGSQAQKPFCVPCFLFVGNRLQPPQPSLSSKWQVQTVANQEKEETQKQERRAILGAQLKGQVSKFGNYLPLILSPERNSIFSTVWFPFCFRELCSSMMTRLLLGGLSWDAKDWSDPGSTGSRKDTGESKWEPLARGKRSSYIHLLVERFCTSESARTLLGKWSP